MIALTIFFEIEQAEGLNKYGPSKEHRPTPIVEMGLFMDGDGSSPYEKSTFYKEHWIKEDELEQKLIITFFLKYQGY